MSQQRRVYQNETVYLPDLARTGHIITATFIDCDLRGPAIVALLEDVQMENVSFGIAQGDVETILWEVPLGSYRLGAIGFRACRIEGGSTNSVGFAGPKETLDKIRRAVPQPR